MKTRNAAYLEQFVSENSGGRPTSAHFELTYRCNLNCPHCYCTRRRGWPELPRASVFGILERLRGAGCFWLALTGGECLLREDFPSIYLRARKLGFMVSVLTNGYALGEKHFALFAKAPPFSVDITLNGVTAPVFDAATGTRGHLPRVLDNIARLSGLGIALAIKANALRSNAGEIAAIKRFAETLHLSTGGRPARFMLDPFVMAGLEGDRGPCALRLSPSALERVYKSEPALCRERREENALPLPAPSRAGKFLYHCTAWREQFFINPVGLARFCVLSEAFGGDLLREPPEKVFAGFGRLRRKVFSKPSKCAGCGLRAFCDWCPAKALQERGDEQAPLLYCCALAKRRARAAGRQ